MPFKPISEPRVRLADKVYGQIMQAIADGSISARDRIVQEKLAEDFGISRTPIREALFRLEQEGILSVSGRGGFKIRIPDEGEIDELYGARAAIEGYSARLLAEAGTPETLARLRQEITALEDLRDTSVRAYFEANMAIHRAFVAAAGNRFLLEQFNNIWGRGSSFALFAEIRKQSMARSLGNHTALVDAIASGDGCLAAEKMIEHILDGRDLQRQVTSAP